MSILQLTQRGWDAVFNPTIRLSADFPLTGKRLGSAYLSATACFFAGSLLPMVLFLGFVFFGLRCVQPTTAKPFLDAVFTNNGEFTTNALVAMCLVSFACGFGMEVWYLRRHLARQGYKLNQVIGFSLASVKGKTRLGTAWALLWRVALAYAAWYCFEHLVGVLITAPEQPTVELVRQLSGGNLWAFFVLAAVVAPILEETVFRGFLFQALRATFRRQQPENEGSSSGGFSSGCAFIAAVLLPPAMLSVYHLTGNSVVPLAMKPALLLTGMATLAGLLLQALYLSRCAARQNKKASFAQCLTGTLAPASFGKCTVAALWRVCAAVVLFAGLTLGSSILQSADLYRLKQFFATETAVWLWILAPAAGLALSELVVSGVPSRLAHNAYAWVLRLTSKTPARADMLAMLISGAVFSVEHLQFQPVTMLMLMLMGCYLAEIYRRTGTLWCGILLHGLNNGLAVVLLALSK